MERHPMRKRMLIMLISLGVLFGGIFLYKVFQHVMIKKYIAAHRAPIVTVSSMKVSYSDWNPEIKAAGSLRTIKGVYVTTELAGMIRNIYFTPGAFVQKGTLLVQLDIEPDVAQLASLEAMAKFYEITYKRDKAQYAVGAVSKETLDSDKANMENGVAQVIEQRANIAKKIIRAPFTGKLGISMVNPGQYLNPGDQIVALQTLDPIYVDFYVPQESIGQLAVGQPINVSIDSFPNETFSGKITTMNPLIDTNSRNVEVEGTLPNPKNKLLPGMFTDVTVVTGSPKKYITLPQTAINFNSYGDIIYILKPTNEKYNDKAVWEANEVFVTTGNTRGDQITVLTGVSVGDIVVTSGQLKLKNKSKVIINNDVQPSNDPDPRPITE